MQCLGFGTHLSNYLIVCTSNSKNETLKKRLKKASIMPTVYENYYIFFTLFGSLCIFAVILGLQSRHKVQSQSQGQTQGDKGDRVLGSVDFNTNDETEAWL